MESRLYLLKLFNSNTVEPWNRGLWNRGTSGIGEPWNARKHFFHTNEPLESGK